jgi:hypothetical protein
MLNINFEFPPQSNSNSHECEATHLGDWVVYRCPKCSDYERRYNWRTGTMKTTGLKTHIHHWGVYDHKEAPENLN